MTPDVIEIGRIKRSGMPIMRLLTPVLVLLLCLPAAAQAPPEAGAAQPSAPAKPAAKANPGKAAKTPPVPAPAKAFYAAMPEAERNAIESDLVWTGDYNGLVGAPFEDRAVAAVQSFQKRNAGKETGILNPDERSRLAQSAKASQERVGWRVVDDPATGARLGIPAKLVPQAVPGKSGGRWQSGRGEVQVETFRVAAPGTTLAAVFEQQKKEPSTRRVEYNVLRADFFVLSGLQGLKKFYVRGQVKDGAKDQVKDNDVRGITILYDQAMEGIMDPVAVAMSSAFAPFPAQAVAGVPAVRRPVEYGTGLVVSAAGHIVTDADLLTGCELIVVPGFGHADRVAADGGLALLRVNGARDLAPVALAAGAPAGEVTLVGIADPQAQNGGKAVSTARGRALANGALDPLPAAGFAGAAALDATGSVAGIVGLHAPGPAAVVPAPAIAKFLGAQNVAPAAGRTGLDAVKAAAVRVICIRK
jgi:hypothetical protein